VGWLNFVWQDWQQQSAGYLVGGLHQSAVQLVPEVLQVLQTSHETRPALNAVQAAVS
jgi:hypothetical protein